MFCHFWPADAFFRNIWVIFQAESITFCSSLRPKREFYCPHTEKGYIKKTSCMVFSSMLLRMDLKMDQLCPTWKMTVSVSVGILRGHLEVVKVAFEAPRCGYPPPQNYYLVCVNEQRLASCSEGQLLLSSCCWGLKPLVSAPLFPLIHQHFGWLSCLNSGCPAEPHEVSS